MLALAVCAQAFAAGTDSAGREFLFAFQPNASGEWLARFFQKDLHLYIASQKGASGTISAPVGDVTESFSVSAGSLKEVALPISVRRLEPDQVSANSVRIGTDRDVTVYALNRVKHSTDAFLVLPVDALGRYYRVLTYPSIDGSSQVAIVATADDTDVHIETTKPVEGRGAPASFDVHLDRGEVYALVGAAPDGDLTGTSVTATAPVGVLAGADCAQVPTGVPACDHLVQMMPPLSTWGNRIVTLPIATRQRGDMIRILASEDNTEIRIDGRRKVSLAAGEVLEEIIARPAVIEATKPVLMGQFSLGTAYDGVTSDPFFVILPPTEQFLDGYVFATPQSGFSINYVNVIIPTAALGSLRLDGQPVDRSELSPIAGSNLSGGALPLRPGVHRLRADEPFGITVYGFDSADSYGYLGGMAFSHINLSVTEDAADEPPGSASLGDQDALALAAMTEGDDQSRPLPLRIVSREGRPLVSVTTDLDKPGIRLLLDDGERIRRLGRRPVQLPLPDDDRPWTLRVRTGHCIGTVTPRQHKLIIQAPTADGSLGSSEIPLLLETNSTPWWRCALPFALAAVALLVAAVIIYGFIWPARFHRQLGVLIANEEDLDEGIFLLLRAQRGTGGGFYRHARAYIREDYRVNGNASAAIACLRADRGRVMLRPMHGSLILSHNEEDAWTPLSATELIARTGTPYRNERGTVYFELRNR